MNRQDKINRLAEILIGAGIVSAIAKQVSKEVLDELFPPLEPIDEDTSMDRHYIPLPGGIEVQTKGKGSSFRIANIDTDWRINIPGTSHEFSFLTEMALQIREAYGE